MIDFNAVTLGLAIAMVGGPVLLFGCWLYKLKKGKWPDWY